MPSILYFISNVYSWIFAAIFQEFQQQVLNYSKSPPVTEKVLLKYIHASNRVKGEVSFGVISGTSEDPCLPKHSHHLLGGK